MTDIGHRVRHAGWSFVIPDGFRLVETGEQPGAGAVGGVHLEHTPVDATVPNYSETPEDLRLAMYPVTIALTPLFGQGGAPLAYLRNAEQVLARHFERFAVDFCESVELDGCEVAARSQARFSTVFPIYRLSYAWLVQRGLVLCTLTVTEPGLERGWERLRSFVSSAQLLGTS